jgi:hypothetical protein
MLTWRLAGSRNLDNFRIGGKTMKRSLCFAIATLAFATFAGAQSDRGRITGVIYDSSGAVVPTATVTITNQATDSARRTSATSDGRYAVDALMPSTYKISVTASGFAEAVVSSLPLAAGQERVQDVTLQPASTQTRVEVVASGELAQVDTRSAALGATVSSWEVQNLPLNGRDLSQLYLQVPGATSSGAGTSDTMRFAGRASEQNTLRYDGIEASYIINQFASDANGFRLEQSLENVQEFHVDSSTYAADQGYGVGGQINVVTKSGSNQFHGGLFEYLRNSFFDARNYFDTGATPAPLKLNQFGGSFGGPIIHDKLFFFVGQENLTQRIGVPFVENTLSAYARSLAVPAIQPLLAAFPVGQQPTSDPYSDVVSRSISSRVDEHFGSIRLDYLINSKNTLYVRYLRDQGESYAPGDASGSGILSLITSQNGVIDLTTVFTPTLLNDFKFGVNAAKFPAINVGAVAPGIDLSNVTVQLSVGGFAGASGIVTPTGVTGNTNHEVVYTGSTLTFNDSLSWNHAGHTVKAGVEVDPRTLYVNLLGGTTYNFNSVQDLLANNPSLVTVAGDLSDPSPFLNGARGIRKALQTYYGSYITDEWKIKPNLTMNAGLRYDYFSPIREAHNLAVVVDSATGTIEPRGSAFYKTSKLDFGPRLAFSWAPERFHNRTVFRMGAGYYYGPGNTSDQTDLVSSGIPVQSFTSGIAYPVDRAQLLSQFNISDPNLQYTPGAFGAGYKLPEIALSYSASFQQVLPDQSVLTIGYVGNQGRNLFLRTIANRITGVSTDPVTGNAIVTRQFGNYFSEFGTKTNGGSMHYDSLQISWNRRFSHGITGSMQYSWSHNIGNSSGSDEVIPSANNYSYAGEWGNNSFDIRQNLNADVLWELPIGRLHRLSFGNHRLLEGIFGGWQLGANVNVRTGLPIDVLIARPDILYRDTLTGLYYESPVIGASGQVESTAVVNVPGGGSSVQVRRPDLVPGVNPYVATSTGYYLNPAAFAIPQPGTYGNLGRNALRGPGFAQLDATVSKRFPISEKVAIELRGDIYNLLNHPNFANPPSQLGDPVPSSPGGLGLPPGSALTPSAAGTGYGLLSSTVSQFIGLGTARQIQLALRLVF